MQFISKQRDQVQSSVTLALVSMTQTSSDRWAFKKAGDADEPQHDRAIAVLQAKLRTALHRLWGIFAREVSVLRSASAEMRAVSDKVSALKRQIVAIRLRNDF
jgi:hypothetical protein